MSRAAKSAKGNGGLIHTPPISSTVALRKLEAAYSKALAEIDRLNSYIEKLKQK